MDKIILPGFYIICIKTYEIDGFIFERGEIEWREKNGWPLTSSYWRRATYKEVNDWLMGNPLRLDMRQFQNHIRQTI